MRFTSLNVLACASLTSLVSAAPCVPTNVAPTPFDITLPGEYTLWARDASGSELLVVRPQFPNAGGFFYPLSLGAANLSVSDRSVPKFIISRSQAYSGGTIIASETGLLLTPSQLYLASDTGQHPLTVVSVNATCDGKQERLLRFNNLLKIPLGGAHLNSSFAPNVGLNTPATTGLLGLAGENVDLLIRDYTE